MDIAVVGPAPPTRGGIAQHLEGLVGALRATGRTVAVWAWKKQYPRFMYRHPERDATAPPLEGARFTLRWWNPFSWLRVGWGVRRAGIVVFEWVTPAHALPLRAIRAMARGRVVIVVHNADPHEPFPGHRLLTRIGLGGTAARVTHSAAVGDRLRLMGLEVAEVIGLPASIDIIAQPAPARPPWALLSFGHVRPYKGVDITIDALARLVADGVDAMLTVAGTDWDEVARLRDRAAPLGDRVAFRPGYLTAAEVSEVFGAHHIVVLSYREGSQSGVIPLAHAAGRPVVVTRVGGLAEAVTDGVDGVVVDAADPASVATGIMRGIATFDELARNAPASVPTWAGVAAAVLRAAGEVG